MLLAVLFNLVLARAAQASLYNPGALKEEFYDLRLGMLPAAVMLMLLLAAILELRIAQDILPVMLLVFIIAGISLVHTVLIKKFNKTAWIVLFYLSLILLPHLLLLLSIIAVADSFYNFRKKLALSA